MRYLLRFARRLGDIVGCLPAAKHLRDAGHEVWFETDPAYADLFHCVDYVRWQNPYIRPDKPFDRVLELQIHQPPFGGPRYQEFRMSGRAWRDFVYDHDDIREAAWRRPVFTHTRWFDPDDYRLPRDREYALLGITGVSQQQKHSEAKVVALAHKLYGNIPMAQLSPTPSNTPGIIHCRRLRELPGLIAHPKHCLLINSGPAWVALGVRESYHHIPQVGTAAQDDSSLPGISIQVTP